MKNGNHLLRTACLCGAALLYWYSASSGRTVTVNPDSVYQTFEGWGTSLCWWANTAGSWDEKNRIALVNAITDPDTGLGYTCFRYNIGGEDNPQHSHISAERAIPGFKPIEFGDYDWNADLAQRRILIGIRAARDGCIFEAFSNSPPWWMTISECSSGNTNGSDNLKPDYFNRFAEYLATVVKYYKNQWNVTFRTVEPFNEPSSGYWKANGGQEGCGFKNNQATMIKALGRQLEEKGLYPETSVSAADETSLAHTVTAVSSYDDSAFHYLSQINTHSYGGWSSREAVRALAARHSKNLWQSESGPLEKSDNSDVALWMADVIIQDLRVLRANAWIDWQVCDQHPDWRSIEINAARQSFTYNKRYYMHAAFSRFIRPGSQIIHSSDDNSVAALVPEPARLVVVLKNSGTSAVDYTVDLSPGVHLLPGDHADLYRFTLPGALSDEGSVRIDDMQFSFSAPAQSITTCVVPRVVTTVGKRYHRVPAARKGTVTGRGNSLTISFASRHPYRLTIYDCTGKRVYGVSGIPAMPTESFPSISDMLPGGMYLVEVIQKDVRFGGTFPVCKP